MKTEKYTQEEIDDKEYGYYFVGCNPFDNLNWWEKLLKKIGFYKNRPKINIEVFKIKNNIIEYIINNYLY